MYSVDTTEKTVAFGDAYGELPTPTWIGRTFLGWFTDIEDGDQITEETLYELTEDQTLYAHWEEKGMTPEMRREEIQKIWDRQDAGMKLFGEYLGAMWD